MPTILDSEIKYNVIALCCTGLTRDSIAEKIGIGKGTVSKFLEEFRTKIGDEQYNTIKGRGMFLRKEKISLKEAVSGANLLSYMEKNGIKNDDIHSFFENLREINNVSNAQELLAVSVKVLQISKETEKSFQEIQEQYEKSSQSVSDLKKYENTLQASIKGLESKSIEALQKNKITKETLRQFTIIRGNFLSIGVNLAELYQYHDALLEIKRQGFDVEKILYDLQELKDLQAMINAKGKYLKKYNQDIEIAKDQIQKVTSELNVMNQQHQHYSYAIKVILEFVKKGQDTSTIVNWNQILQHCKMSISEFDFKLKKHSSFTNYLVKLVRDVRVLENNKEILKTETGKVETGKVELQKTLVYAQTMLDEKINRAKMEIENLSANPLRLVNQVKKPYEVLPILLIFCKEFHRWLEVHKIHDQKILHSVDDLKSETERIMKKQ